MQGLSRAVRASLASHDRRRGRLGESLVLLNSDRTRQGLDSRERGGRVRVEVKKGRKNPHSLSLSLHSISKTGPRLHLCDPIRLLPDPGHGCKELRFFFFGRNTFGEREREGRKKARQLRRKGKKN